MFVFLKAVHVRKEMVYLVWLSLLFVGIIGCGKKPRGSVNAFVPETSTLALMTTPIEGWPEALTGTFGRLPGGEGMLDWAEGAWGIDFSSEEALLKIGIETTQGIHLFSQDGSSYLLVPIRDGEKAFSSSLMGTSK